MFAEVPKMMTKVRDQSLGTTRIEKRRKKLEVLGSHPYPDTFQYVALDKPLYLFA